MFQHPPVLLCFPRCRGFSQPNTLHPEYKNEMGVAVTRENEIKGTELINQKAPTPTPTLVGGQERYIASLESVAFSIAGLY